MMPTKSRKCKVVKRPIGTNINTKQRWTKDNDIGQETMNDDNDNCIGKKRNDDDEEARKKNHE